MVNYPLVFGVEAWAESGMVGVWKASAAEGRQVIVAIPPEFGGPGGGFSPEDLYALALLNCFAATFKVIAERSRLVYSEVRLEGSLTVDRNDSGAPWMKHFELRARLAGCADGERGLRLLQKTSESCLILNSVRTEKSFHFELGA